MICLNSDKVTGQKRYLLQEMQVKCSRLNIPMQAVLELTCRCNLRCVHCYVDAPADDELTQTQRNTLDLRQFRHGGG